MKYKVNFSGFAYVEANSQKEAKNNFITDDIVYSEQCIDSVEEIDDFAVEV